MAAMISNTESGAVVIECAVCGLPLFKFLPSQVRRFRQRYRGDGKWEDSATLAKWAEDLYQTHIEEQGCHGW